MDRTKARDVDYTYARLNSNLYYSDMNSRYNDTIVLLEIYQGLTNWTVYCFDGTRLRVSSKYFTKVDKEEWMIQQLSLKLDTFG